MSHCPLSPFFFKEECFYFPKIFQHQFPSHSVTCVKEHHSCSKNRHFSHFKRTHFIRDMFLPVWGKSRKSGHPRPGDTMKTIKTERCWSRARGDISDKCSNEVLTKTPEPQHNGHGERGSSRRACSCCAARKSPSSYLPLKSPA